MKQQGSVLLVSLILLSVLAMATAHSLQQHYQYIRLLSAQQKQANALLHAENTLLSVVKQNSDLWQQQFATNYRSCFRAENGTCDDNNLQIDSDNSNEFNELYAEFISHQHNSYWSVFIRYENDVRLVLELSLKPSQDAGQWHYYD